MTTALDSSVIIDVLIDDHRALKQARAQGQLIVSSYLLAEITPVVGEKSVIFAILTPNLDPWPLLLMVFSKSGKTLPLVRDRYE